MTFPLPLETLVGKPLMYAIFAVIGFGFGFVLESSGFGNSKKLAAQFYFRDMTVLKVMFGAISWPWYSSSLWSARSWISTCWVNPHL
jgi:hypothetical protein